VANLAVQSAIDESILRNAIVHVEATPEDLEDLACECDDSVSDGPVTEFWGADDDGRAWRVHATAQGVERG
jgi:hypothetical protein